MAGPTVETGLDRLAAGDESVLRLVRGRRVGVLAHPASVDAHIRHTLEVMRGMGANVCALFGPEHGWAGQAQDMIGVGSGDGERVPIHSLYGETEDDLSPRAEHLEGLDVVVVDLQDVGSRYYTYVWSAALMLKAAAAQGVQTLALDRPNPLGGEIVEGAPQRSGYRSFVGLYDVSVRHGLTLGEILTMVCDVDGIGAEALEVVRMQGWSRGMSWEQTGLPWVLPSPNMPTADTARVYPGGCLVEGTNLSEGRGQTRPFEIWGAPFVDGERLASEVALDGATLRALHFQPTFHKHAGSMCGGVQVHVSDPEVFRPYAAYLRLIAAVRAQAPDSFAWRRSTYEYVSDRPAIDLLTGGPEYRQCVDEGRSVDDLIEREAQGAEAFAARREPWLLYG